jgi:hypothetical protein
MSLSETPRSKALEDAIDRMEVPLSEVIKEIKWRCN